MAYQTQDGRAVPSGSPSDVLSDLAANCFGGPKSLDDYTAELAQRTPLWNGSKVDPKDHAALVDILLESQILTKVD